MAGHEAQASAETERVSIFYKPQGRAVAPFEYAFHNRLPVTIKGPTGCGRSRFVRDMAERQERLLCTVAFHDDLRP